MDSIRVIHPSSIIFVRSATWERERTFSAHQPHILTKKSNGSWNPWGLSRAMRILSRRGSAAANPPSSLALDEVNLFARWWNGWNHCSGSTQLGPSSTTESPSQKMKPPREAFGLNGGLSWKIDRTLIWKVLIWANLPKILQRFHVLLFRLAKHSMILWWFHAESSIPDLGKSFWSTWSTYLGCEAQRDSCMTNLCVRYSSKTLNDSQVDCLSWHLQNRKWGSSWCRFSDLPNQPSICKQIWSATMRCCGETYRIWRDFGASLLGLFLKSSRYFPICFFFSKHFSSVENAFFTWPKPKPYWGHPKKRRVFLSL